MQRAKALLFVSAGIFAKWFFMQKAYTLSWPALSIAALAITGLDAAPALAVDLPAGAATAGPCGMIVMAEGNIFTMEAPHDDLCPPRPWVLAGNVFSSAGTGAPGPIVGVNELLQVLAENGDWFSLIAAPCAAVAASYEGNVFELTGVRVPGEKFVTFGGRSPTGGYEYAATNLGNVYRRDTCTGSSWSYLGNLAGAPTPTEQSTWGLVKARYR